MSDYLEKHRFVNCAAQLARRYYDHLVARDCAALTYYLLFAIFPLLIFLNNLVGILSYGVDELLNELDAVMPREVLELLGQYLGYVSATSSRTLLWFSLIFTIYFPFRAANALFRSVRKAYGLEQPTQFVCYQLRVLLYTLLLIVTIVFAFSVSVVGKRALNFISGYVYLSDGVVRLWTSFRFVLLGALLFVMIALLYALAQDTPREKRGIWPGVLSALIAWLALSMLFSLYVERAARYSVIYGSIGTIIVLLLWLYLTATMLIMGAEFNSVLLHIRKKQETKEK